MDDKHQCFDKHLDAVNSSFCFDISKGSWVRCTQILQKKPFVLKCNK